MLERARLLRAKRNSYHFKSIVPPKMQLKPSKPGLGLEKVRVQSIRLRCSGFCFGLVLGFGQKERTSETFSLVFSKRELAKWSRCMLE